jgi:L-lactate dehydrogenase complex protein LldG
MFVKNAKAAGTAVYECAPAALNETILAAIAELASGPILLADDPLWQEQNTIAALQKVHDPVRLWNTGQSRESNLEYAEAAAVGIAVANLALAETGTVMVYSHKGCGRSVTLLPQTTIFVIRREDIRRRLTQAMEHIQEDAELPSSINFISAASSTADIELVRVQGVHGPVRITSIVID